MDLKFCGILDILIVFFLLIACIIGYKKGFLKKAIGLVSFLVALIVAFVFCSQLAGLLKQYDVIYPSIYESVFENVSSSQAFMNPDATVADVLKGMDVPGFIADLLAKAIGENIGVAQMAESISTYITDMAMNAICFLILLVGVFIVAFILKIIANVLRGNFIIRFVDGLLGMALYACIFLVVVYLVFMILRYSMDASWFAGAKSFLTVDMKLDEPDVFRLSKYIYEHNVLYNIFHILF